MLQACTYLVKYKAAVLIKMNPILYSSFNSVRFPDKTTDHPLAQSAWETSTLAQGQPCAAQARVII